MYLNGSPEVLCSISSVLPEIQISQLMFEVVMQWNSADKMWKMGDRGNHILQRSFFLTRQQRTYITSTVCMLLIHTHLFKKRSFIGSKNMGKMNELVQFCYFKTVTMIFFDDPLMSRKASTILEYFNEKLGLIIIYFWRQNI